MKARQPRALLAGALAAVLLSGCAQSVDPIERLGRKAAQKVVRRHGRADRTYRRWGLGAPLAPAPRPARPPADAMGSSGAGLPVVLDRVPTRDKVVFLTYDEGVENNPRFVEMVRELRLPVSVFLTESATGPEYVRIARLREAGADIQNRTMDHTALRGRPYDEQRAGICGQQNRLKTLPGPPPRLLRPPYGRYDRTTLRAAAGCGITALILWRAQQDMEPGPYDSGMSLRPGDIVRPHETGRPLAAVTTETIRVLRRIQAKGLTVARLEDYL